MIALSRTLRDHAACQPIVHDRSAFGREIFGPAGLPRDVVDKFNAAVKNALAQPELKDKLATIGLSPTPMTPEQLKAFISAEIVKWTRIVKDANIQPE